jgi:hypothetical protein
MEAMFFRRKKPKEYTFAERLDMLRRAGFVIQSEGPSKAVAIRSGCAAVVEDVPGEAPRISKAGRIIGNEIGELVDLGYQKEWRTLSGAREPALAEQLKGLHAMTEDLRENLGIISRYNESLGTVNDSHLYDRVAGRESRP